jgi:tetratricopeptide (TPR) repeat protein
MTNEKHLKIILSEQIKIQSYTSELVKKGLSLARELAINSSEISESTDTYIEKQDYQWKHFCKIIHPKNKITAVSINSNKKLIGAIDAWSIVNIFSIESEKSNFLFKPFLSHYKELPNSNAFFYESELKRYESFKKNGENFDFIFISDDQKFISIGNLELKIWDSKNRTLESKISGTVFPIVNHKNHIIAYDVGFNEIKLWNIDEAKIVSEIKTGYDNIWHLALCKNGKMLAVSGSNCLVNDLENEVYINEYSIKIWNLDKGSFIQTDKYTDTENITNSPQQIYINEVSRVLVGVDDTDVFDNFLFTIRAWDLNSGKLLYQTKIDNNLIKITDQGYLIFASKKDENKVLIHDLMSGKLLKTIQNKDTKVLDVSNDGKIIACANSNKEISIWNVETGEFIYISNELESSIKDLKFSQDDKNLISIHSDGSANIWEFSKSLRDDENSFDSYSLNFQMVPESLIEINPQGFLQNGIDAFEKSNFEDSIENLTMALDHDPQNGYAYMYRARARYSLGHKQRAIEDFSQVLLINPDYAEVYYYRGLIQAELNNFSEAFEDYSEAIRINPIFLNAYNSRSSVRSALGDYQGAIEDIQKAKNLNL